MINFEKVHDMLKDAKDEFDRSENIGDIAYWVGYATALQEVILLDLGTELNRIERSLE